MGMHSDEGRKRIADAAKAMWADPERKARLLASRAAAEDRRRENLSTAGKAAWKDPETRQRMLETRKPAKRAGTDAAKKTADAMRRQWADPVVKATRSAAIKAGWSKVVRKPKKKRRAPTAIQRARANERQRKRATTEPAKAYAKAYYKANKERIFRNVKKSGAKRRAKLASVEYEVFTFEEIAERDKWRCYLCGKRVARKDASLDHVIPIVKGGGHTRTNVKLAHLRCNKRKHASIVTLF